MTEYNITTTTETVGWEALEAFAGLIGIPGELIGSIESDKAYTDTVASLRARYSGLTIEYREKLFRFAGNPGLKEWLLREADSEADGVIGEDEVKGITRLNFGPGISSLALDPEYPNLLALTVALRDLTVRPGTGLTGTLDLTGSVSLETIETTGTTLGAIVGSGNTGLHSVHTGTPGVLKLGTSSVKATEFQYDSSRSLGTFETSGTSDSGAYRMTAEFLGIPDWKEVKADTWESIVTDSRDLPRFVRDRVTKVTATGDVRLGSVPAMSELIIEGSETSTLKVDLSGTSSLEI